MPRVIGSNIVSRLYYLIVVFAGYPATGTTMAAVQNESRAYERGIRGVDGQHRPRKGRGAGDVRIVELDLVPPTAHRLLLLIIVIAAYDAVIAEAGRRRDISDAYLDCIILDAKEIDATLHAVVARAVIPQGLFLIFCLSRCRG